MGLLEKCFFSPRLNHDFIYLKPPVLTRTYVLLCRAASPVKEASKDSGPLAISPVKEPSGASGPIAKAATEGGTEIDDILRHVEAEAGEQDEGGIELGPNKEDGNGDSEEEEEEDEEEESGDMEP